MACTCVVFLWLVVLFDCCFGFGFGFDFGWLSFLLAWLLDFFGNALRGVVLF